MKIDFDERLAIRGIGVLIVLFALAGVLRRGDQPLITLLSVSIAQAEPMRVESAPTGQLAHSDENKEHPR